MNKKTKELLRKKIEQDFAKFYSESLSEAIKRGIKAKKDKNCLVKKSKV